MPDYLLDTNILSYWYRKGCPQRVGIVAKVAQLRQPDPQSGYVSRLFISVVTLSEVEYGHRVNPSPNQTSESSYLEFIRREVPPALEISRHIREPYALLRSWLFENCSPREKRARRPEELVNPITARELGIDENDLWIAAHAALHNLVLVTADGLSNLRRAIDAAGVGPQLEDWTKP